MAGPARRASDSPFTRAVATYREANPGAWVRSRPSPRLTRGVPVLGGDLRGPRRPADGLDVSPSESDPTLADATVSLIWPDIDRATEVKAGGGAWLLGLDATLAAVDGFHLRDIC